MNARGTRASAVGFALFWVAIAIACLVVYSLIGALGLGARPTRTLARPIHTHTRAAPHSAVTLSSIFSPRAPSLRGYHRDRLTTLIATGDVIPGRSVNYKMTTYGDFLYPFRRTAAYLRTGNITLINLESPLINGCPVTTEGMSFCGDPRAVQGLKFAGVDVACTANNHIGNYGVEGINETWQHLAAAGIRHCGYGNATILTVHGIRFGFLAYNAVGQRFDYALARQQIRAARRHADVVIVSVHWGKEYVAVPSIAPGIADDNPRRIAHWIIDSGADLIIGNHPHHIQGVEMYRGKLITYAHGNFVFDQMFGIADCPGSANFVCSTREGVVGTYTFYGKRLVSVRYRPVVIYDYSQPRWATPQQAKVILAGMKQASIALLPRSKPR
jgi:hypothetical protein